MPQVDACVEPTNVRAAASSHAVRWDQSQNRAFSYAGYVTLFNPGDQSPSTGQVSAKIVSGALAAR
jgi:hypothetical protein